MKSVLFVYNPISGDGTLSTNLDSIIHQYQRSGFTVTPVRITRDLGFKPVAELVKRLDPHHILVAGGDGTVNRFVNYMKDNELDVPLAILPTGTANDFAGTLGISSRITRAVREIISGQEVLVDLGRVGEKYFVNILSSGLMAEVSQRTPTVLKNTFGKVAYYFGSIGELPNFRKLNISVESQELTYRGQCLLFMVFNGRTAGSIPVAQSASVTDGLLDVLIIKGENIAYTIQTLFHFLLQRQGQYPHDVVYFQTSKMTIQVEGLHPATDVDGERGVDFPLEVECLPRALRVIIPSK